MAKTKTTAEPKVATDFDKIIKDGRERKKNEALAEKIFSRDRRQSAPSKTKLGAGPSLASRVGVKKRASIGPSKPSPAGNIDGDWTHDLHSSVNGGRNLASRITAPGASANAPKNRSAGRRAELRATKIANAIERSEAQPVVAATKPPPSLNKGLSIRGLAGPFAVMAQNFAPGTSAADIESAMTPVGGEMVSCTVVKTIPIMLVEMVFASKEGGEAVISTFDNQTADGRLIKVYPKPGGYREPKQSQAPFSAPSAPRAQRSNEGKIVDGLNGFGGDLMDTDQYSSSNGRLYSDKLVGGGGGGGARRGRGRGRGGR